MWAAMFSRKKPAAAAPVEVRAIEVTATTTTAKDTTAVDRAAPENEKPAPKSTSNTTTTTTTTTTTATTSKGSISTPTITTTVIPTEATDKDPRVRIKSEPTSRASTPATTTTRPKRPRTSDSHLPATSPHLRKRARHSLGPTNTRSPLIRAPRDVTTTTAAIKTESRTPPKQQLPTPTTSITESITTLTLLSPQPAKPKRRSRLSLPADDDSSVISTTTELDTDELMREGFSADEVTLFQRIRRRGLEPLMPAHWQVDFATMPDNLFQDPGEQAVIEGLTLEGTFAATAAFQAMVNLGAGVRGKLETRREVESRILGVLRRYVCWAVEDAALDKRHIQPMIAISSSQERGAEHCEQRMDKKLHDLAAEFRAEEAQLIAAGHEIKPESPSTVYGMAVAGCVVALITLDARNRKAPTRTLLVVDFSDVTLDFWNAVGIALVVIAARDDELLRLDRYGELGLEKPERKDGAMAWMGRVKIRKLSDEDDEDK